MSLQEFKDSHGTYYQLNNIKDKPITIFIHGVGLDNTMWYPQKKFFSSKPVLFYDLINHGQSTGGYKKLNFEIDSFNIVGLYDPSYEDQTPLYSEKESLPKSDLVVDFCTSDAIFDNCIYWQSVYKNIIVGSSGLTKENIAHLSSIILELLQLS